ncbi:unnamed protein product [Rotaria sp. Silwood2]|nr:unnamed protein product [Rotaria sp. Silwood2]CAF3356337.1 unnamed protein product [Rotaria sp. Silwood2]CAF4275702.1 unnamed protein product [Rotaria sp. Silwood2]CAF4275718.1 unnamed protein product [Rotaria sp. Silwood2]CAF4457320.1 unnamed protein product [Rotaria sp. Silwood2]
MSISSIENLSDELFYEIFDYLDSYQIFSIHLCSPQNTNQIISSLNIDSSFIRLESLILNSIEPDLLTTLLRKLICLPCIFSLVISTLFTQKDLGDTYRLIFNLQILKYMKYIATEPNDFDITILLLMATNEQITSIEYLIMDHPCAMDELFAIISDTPHLQHLKFLSLTSRNVNTRDIKPIPLPNLIHLSIHTYSKMSFNMFREFISILNSKIKVLSLTTLVEDITYLDADRWENFILTKLPESEKFYFK